METLEKSQEAKIVSAVEDIINRSREPGQRDLNKVAADVFRETDLNPEMVRRGCEAFNKSKSMYMLQKTSSEHRGDSFPIIDPNEVLKQLCTVQKESSFRLLNKDFASMEAPAQPAMQLHKQADDQTEAIGAHPEDEEPKPGKLSETERAEAEREKDPEYMRRKLKKHETALTQSLRKLEDNASQCKIAMELHLQKAVDSMKYMDEKALPKVARLIVNKFGEPGVALMKLAFALLDKPEIPIQKTAQAAVFPCCRPYTDLVLALDNAKAFRCADLLCKEASFRLRGAQKEIRKEALSPAGAKALDPMLQFAYTPIYNQMVHEKSEEPAKEVFDPNFQNQMKTIDTTQTFIDILNDPYIKNYPAEHGIQAFNNVVSVFPELQRPKYKPWLAALVKQQLTQGNVFDAASIEQLSKLRSDLSKTELGAAQKAKLVADRLSLAGTSSAGSGYLSKNPELAERLLMADNPFAHDAEGGEEGGGAPEGSDETEKRKMDLAERAQNLREQMAKTEKITYDRPVDEMLPQGEKIKVTTSVPLGSFPKAGIRPNPGGGLG